VLKKGTATYRSVTINGAEVEFSGGFADLHTAVYQKTLDGEGFGIEEARASIDLAYQIRNALPSGIERDNVHPYLIKIKK
jgi:UDP-N-acetyl-2-amino-2-deoxyglucuronate dehydrogenase